MRVCVGVFACMYYVCVYVCVVCAPWIKCDLHTAILPT